MQEMLSNICTQRNTSVVNRQLEFLKEKCC